VFFVGSPWVAGKALATASPAVALVALVACAMLLARGHRVLGLLAGAAIATGIVWSNVLGYHDVSLAPHEQMAELADIGKRTAGQGPTLMTSSSTFGTRYFLRESEPESAEGELRLRADPLVTGQQLARGAHGDVDQFQLSSVLQYRTLLLRASPLESRPPSPYKLVFHDHYWDVWQRPVLTGQQVIAQTGLGNALEPGGVASCGVVSNIARTPGAQQLEAQPVENPIVVHLGEEPHPKRWASGEREYVNLAGPGTERTEVEIVHAGRYTVWLGGSFTGPVTVSVSDGQHSVTLGTARYELALDGQYVQFGEIELDHGTFTVSISYNGGDWWRPGSGQPPASVGPLVLKRQTPEPQPIVVPVSRARTLCGHTLDWIEAVDGK
jgi:hypothetical protein